MPSLFSGNPLSACRSLNSSLGRATGANSLINTSDHVVALFRRLCEDKAWIKLRLPSMAPKVLHSQLSAHFSVRATWTSQHPCPCCATSALPAFVCGHTLALWLECHSLAYFWYYLGITGSYCCLLYKTMSNSEVITSTVYFHILRT